MALPKRFKEQAEETYSISESEISMLSGATGVYCVFDALRLFQAKLSYYSMFVFTVETLLDSGGGGRIISCNTFPENISHSSESNLFGNWILGDSQVRQIFFV